MRNKETMSHQVENFKEKKELEEKVKELQERLCETLSEVLGTPPEATHVIVEEHDKRNWSVGGVRYIDR